MFRWRGSEEELRWSLVLLSLAGWWAVDPPARLAAAVRVRGAATLRVH